MTTQTTGDRAHATGTTETAVDFSAYDNALDAVRQERWQQDQRWGIQRHSWPEWMLILSEESLEATQAANHAHWGGPGSKESLAAMRQELIHVAAVAVAIIEHIDEILEQPR